VLRYLDLLSVRSLFGDYLIQFNQVTTVRSAALRTVWGGSFNAISILYNLILHWLTVFLRRLSVFENPLNANLLTILMPARSTAIVMEFTSGMYGFADIG